MRRQALILTLALACGGCGFYLAGSQPVAAQLHSVDISFDQPYRVGPPPVVDALKARLGDGGSNPGGHLHISHIDNRQQVLAVSPIDGRATAYELTSTVTFSFDVGKKTLLSNDEVSTRRSFGFDNTARLAGDAERRDLIAAMQRELADQIVLRLQTALAKR